MTKKMTKVKDLHNKMMQNDSKYRKAYNELENEYSLIRAMLEAKEESGLSQKQIAKKMGTSEAALSRLLSGDQDPNWNTIWKFGKAVGKTANLQFA